MTAADSSEMPEEPLPQEDAYIVISELTGLPVIISPPGTPMITSEQVRELLKDFP